MGIYLSDREIASMRGESHALITMYTIAIRPRMNYETGVVGTDPRISYRALVEWCYIEPNPTGGVKPDQLSIPQARRLIARMEKIGLITKTTIEDKSTGREYIQLFCALASLKKQEKPQQITAAQPEARATAAASSSPQCNPTRPFTTSRIARISRRGHCRSMPLALAKNEQNAPADQCAQIATDRGVDSLKPSNGKGFREGVDRGVDTHQRNTKVQPLPPTPFIPGSKKSVVGSGDFDKSVSNPSVPQPTAQISDEDHNMNPYPAMPAPLIWPICIHDTQKIAILQHLSSSLQPQALLDELAGAHQAGKIRTSPIGYLMGLIRRDSEGSFIPERGIAVLETRKANTRYVAARKESESAPAQRQNEAAIPLNSALGKALAKAAESRKPETDQ